MLSDEVLDQVPVSITVSKVGDEWYLTTTHLDPDDHDHHEHIEIRLDRERLHQLYGEVARTVLFLPVIRHER
jgi:hypothetical protein